MIGKSFPFPVPTVLVWRKMRPFLHFEKLQGLCWEETAPESYPSSLRRWQADHPVGLENGGTHFIFVTQGPATLRFLETDYLLHQGMYAAVPGSCSIENGAGIAISRSAHRGFFHLGGPVEEAGRLRYIDGCTDSLLIPPVRMGDPCLNLLHIPPHTRQSRHTHPSHRVGVILSGSGECVTPSGIIPLSPGMVFVIPEDAEHSFHTSNEALRVIAYHPESDCGPTDESHPMVNKTILSAS